MSLDQFLDSTRGPDRTLVVVNRSVPRPVQTMLEETFSSQPVDVRERDLTDEDADLVLLVEETAEGPDVVASSPLDSLMNAILLVNSDIYTTSTRSLDDLDLPDVLTMLDDVQFSLRGYPESHKEKLLLITLSRYIERRALRRGEGTIRSSFQRLSRIDDERGTRTVYENLARSGVQTHLYGLPDWQQPMGFDVTTHGGFSRDFRDSWFVVYTPPEGATDPDGESDHVALLALESKPRTWVGYWTFRPELVTEMDAYIAHNM